MMVCGRLGDEVGIALVKSELHQFDLVCWARDASCRVDRVDADFERNCAHSAQGVWRVSWRKQDGC